MRYKEIDGQINVTSQEMSKAISAFKSRLFTTLGRGAYGKFLQQVKTLAEKDSVSERVATINVAKLYPYELENMSADELPLWGYRAESLVDSERRATRESTKNGQGIKEVLAERPAFKEIRDEQVEEAAMAMLLINVPLDRACPERESMLWALNRVSLPFSRMGMEDVPSRLALEILILCRKDQDFCMDLMKKYLDKSLPSKQQMEYEQSFQEDGRRMEEFLNGVLSSLKESESEDRSAEESSQEHPVSAGGDGGLQRR